MCDVETNNNYCAVCKRNRDLDLFRYWGGIPSVLNLLLFINSGLESERIVGVYLLLYLRIKKTLGHGPFVFEFF